MDELDYQWLSGKADAKNRLQRLRAFCKSIKAFSLIAYIARAQDYYARSIIDCTEMVSYGGIMAVSGLVMALPVTFSSNYSSLGDPDNDCRELMRADSKRERATTRITKFQPFPRSFSTPMDHRCLDVGRIDEERLSYFSASFEKTVVEDLRFPWSRSYSSYGHSLILHGR